MSSPRSRAASFVMLPVWLIVSVGYIATLLWTVYVSLTSSRLTPKGDYVGIQQYFRLFTNARWLASLDNLGTFAVMSVLCSLVLGTVLAIALDRDVRCESVFRTVLLYPYALSMIVTGVIWQWLMNPTLGVQNTVRGWGAEWFTFDWSTNPNMAVYALVIAATWQGSGLVMAILLAGLRGVNQDIWRATRVENIPAWRTYRSIVIPELWPNMAAAIFLLSISAMKSYDLMVALTGGGPGFSSELPSKVIMDNLFTRQNLGLASAGAVSLLLITIGISAPWLYIRSYRRGREA